MGQRYNRYLESLQTTLDDHNISFRTSQIRSILQNRTYLTKSTIMKKKEFKLMIKEELTKHLIFSKFNIRLFSDAIILKENSSKISIESPLVI